MTQFLTTLKTTGRAAVVALALGGVALSAMPAQAAPQVGIQLGLGGFNGGSFGLYFGDGNGPSDNFDYCMTDRQVRRALANQGWNNVKIGDDYDDSRVIVVAQYHGTWYKLRVNRCTGKVDKVQRIKKINNGNFDLYLNFN